MNPDFMPRNGGWTSLPKLSDEECKARDLENPTSARELPAWERPNRRRKPDHVKRAKTNRARAERKRKQKSAKKRS